MTRHRRGPTFHQLDQAECEALLSRHSVGRLAFTFHDRVDIEPIHYVHSNGHLFGRTRFGTKVEILAHHPWVAFEVDEVDALFSWRSVVIHGHVSFPDPNGAAVEHEQYERGVETFRRLVPQAFTADDPTPDRELVFCILVHDMTGRAAAPDGDHA